MSEVKNGSSTVTPQFDPGRPPGLPTTAQRARSAASGTGPPSRIAVIGNYLPRQCGIATFTTDLCEALLKECGAAQLFAVPVNDTESGYEYPERVRIALEQDNLCSYDQVAAFLNFANFDLVCLQHEYGIFGGPAGSHILHLLRQLKMPVITTLHTVLREPNPDQRAVMDQIAALSDRLIVMSELSSQLLQEIFKVPGTKINIVPHGVPDLPFLDPNFYKDRFGVEGKAVLLTFGLLSPNKGIENVIQAMPHILSRHNNSVYIVAGATHPHILRREGDHYRAHLQALAKEIGVESKVVFYNRFASPKQMAEFIGAADIYITPYRHEEQLVSGTLAYALGAGKAIISTPYWHAIESLDDRRGALVPFQDPEAIARKSIELLDTPAIRHAMRKRAYLYSREMIWKRVAHSYMESFGQDLFEIALPAVTHFTSPRAWAFSVLGIREYLDSFPGDRNARRMSSDLTRRLIEIYVANESSNWHWFEDVLAYSNARLPQAVLAAGLRNSDREMVAVALAALNWLNEIHRCAGQHHFVPIGSQGFYRKGGERARFDQQPVEADGVVSACLEAYRATGDGRWRDEAWSAFNWFLGDNDLQIALYDPTTGGCRDGLHPDRVNENQGAESTLAFLTAQVEMRLLERAEGFRLNRDLVSGCDNDEVGTHVL